MRTVVKAPTARKDWMVKFGRRFTSSDEIQNSTVDITIPNGDITVDLSPLKVYHLEWEGTDVTIWLSGGTHDTTYQVTITAEGTLVPSGKSKGLKEPYNFLIEVNNDTP